ncbi:hypothetical protein QUB75_01520 [Microcoleus sp. K1-B6]|uniref:hypothetical protein n=1 Tax=unclassified Microcoleus TaxID=2642155 RepID=UPI002FCF1503
MLVSTFEILLKPQLPKNFSQLGNVSRKVLQGYFLTIANPNNFNVSLELSFTVSPSFFTELAPAAPNQLPFGKIDEPSNFNRVLVFFDVNGGNQKLTLQPTERPDTRIASLSIPAKDTGLFILQPSPFVLIPVANPQPPDPKSKTLLDVANFEVRGYVEIERTSPASPVKLLLIPEHRGTFFKDLTSSPQLDQIAYSLPTATGGSLFTL